MAQFGQSLGMSKKPTSYLDVMKQKEEVKPKFNLFDFSSVKKEQPTQTLNFGQPISQRNVTNFQQPTQTQPTQKSGFSLIPTANADESLFDKYMNDPQISKQGKFKMLSQVQSGEITEEDANGIISQIYGQTQPTQDINQMGLIDEAGQRLSNLGTKLGERAGRIGEDFTRERSKNPFIAGGQNLLAGVGSAGEIIGGLGDIAFEGLAYATPDIVKEGLYATGRGIKAITPEAVKKGLVATGKAMGEEYKEFKKDSPFLARGVEGTGNIATVLPIAKGGKVVGKGIEKTGEVLTKGGKVLGKGVGKITPDLSKTADILATKINRMSKPEINSFKEEIGVSPGKFLNDRGITDTGDDLIEKLGNNLKQSRQEADKGLESIQGTFKAPKEKIATDIIDSETGKYIIKEQDPIETMLKDNLTNASNKGMAQDSLRAKELLEKYKEGGLSMSEVNEAKRWFNANNKFGYFADDTTSRKGFVTNLDNTIRKWQYDTAEKMGFGNLQEVNKQTKAYYKLLTGITKWEEGTKGNLGVGLTDWLAFNADPGVFLAKQVAQSGMLKKGALKLLNIGRKTQPEVKPALISNQAKNVNNIPNSPSSSTMEGIQRGNVKPSILSPREKSLLKPNQPKNEVSNPTTTKTSENGRKVLKPKKSLIEKLQESQTWQKVGEKVDKYAENVGAKKNLLPSKVEKQVGDDLINEARKYKSAEEFINTKRKSKNMLHHGTSIKFDKFDKEKLGSGGGSIYGEGIFLSDNVEVAKSFAKGVSGGKEGVILDIPNIKKLKLKEYNGPVENLPDIQEQAIKEGYDGIKYPTREDYAHFNKINTLGSNNYLIFPESIEKLNIIDLKQIYEQANKTKLLKKTK